MYTTEKIWDFMSARGNYVLSMKKLMELTVLLIGGFHVGLLVFFWYFGVYPLVFVNIISVSIYVFCVIWIRKRKELLYVFNITYIEVLVHSVIASLLLGADSGFTLYLIAMLPLGYYAAYNFSSKDRQINPMFYIFISGAAFLLVRIMNQYIEPPYSYGNEMVDRTIYIINYFVAVISVVSAFSTLLNQIKSLDKLRLQQNKRLEKLSKIDPLTGLVNRRTIEERYAQAEVLKEDYTLILGDVDNFKKVNDTYGHDAGDNVLKMVAEAFKTNVREEDMVCRWGGEEILVFLPKCNRVDAIDIAERIRKSICESNVELEGQKPIHVTITLGVAVYREGDEFSKVVGKADERLYRGKRKGKNCVIGI